jgi:uncharacterized protein YyaL (SSP411 family)
MVSPVESMDRGGAYSMPMNRVSYGRAVGATMATLLSLLVTLMPMNVSADAAGVTYPPELNARLREALMAKGADYEPRTEHLRGDGSPVYTNRLILEGSPYLLQHAHNPVDWYPWGAEAFEKARRENKPIFLSIGYSTCHWCHVMERESFEDEAIARLLNEHFVAIKVDREQHPDVDSLYMTAVMLINRQGGWPMSSFLTPDGKTFFGGTYFPPREFRQLLARIDELWRTDRAGVLAQADRVARAVASVTATGEAARRVGTGVVLQAVADLQEQHDEMQGGFGSAPKFPNETFYLLLLDHALRTGDREVIGILRFDLDVMARGGIYDQVGGGFHRYSTDNEWLVPHFEKMLYNQANLARVYLLAHRLTGDAAMARIARETLDYVLRDMRSPEGVFYSATDADSEGGEGRFFLWTPKQLKAVLPAGEAELFIDLYGVTERGNFEGGNILSLADPLETYAADHQLDPAELLKRVKAGREALYQARERREHPLRDDKIVVAWNAMMITALATAADVLGDEGYRRAAERAGRFLWERQRRGDGGLWRVRLDGRPSVEGRQEDYAYLAEAYVHLYDLGRDAVWLQRARELTDRMLERFWDAEDGGFFMAGADPDTPMMVRPKDGDDGAIPSGNSVALNVLAMLALRTGEEAYRERANELLAAFSGRIAAHPRGFTYMLHGARKLWQGEAGPNQYAARGVVAVRAGMDGDGRAWLDLEIKDGWHINSHAPLQDNLVPTRVSLDDDGAGWKLGAVEWPEAEVKALGFQRDRLSLYEGKVRLNLPVERTGDGMLTLRLGLQACSDQVCLPPEELRIPVGR